jgi:hypothetical protein
MCTIHHLRYILKTKLQSSNFQCAAAVDDDDNDHNDRGFDDEVRVCGVDDYGVDFEGFNDFHCPGINFGSKCRCRVSFTVYISC